MLISRPQLCAAYLAALFTVSACQHRPERIAALQVQPSEASHQELLGFIKEGLGARHSLGSVSKPLFTKYSLFALEHKDLTGRQLEMPRRFQLFKVGDQCELEYLDTGQRWLLKHVNCAVESGIQGP